MYRREKSVVGEMCSRVNIRSGKCPFEEMSSRGNSRWGKCLVGEMSSRGSVGRGIVQSGMCQSGMCRLGKCPVGEVFGSLLPCVIQFHSSFPYCFLFFSVYYFIEILFFIIKAYNHLSETDLPFISYSCYR